MEILQQAMMSLPDTSELDSKLTVAVESLESADTSSQDQLSADGISPLDRLMCDIVDQLWDPDQHIPSLVLS